MEPKLPAPSSLPEFPSREQNFVAPERPFFNNKERDLEVDSQQETREAQPIHDQGAAAAAAAQLASVPGDPALNNDSTNVQTIGMQDDTPLVADDDDLIEKTWVDKAKNIVAQTKNDPYQQELEVSKLQANYLFKRYGKQIKLSSKE